MKKEEQDSFFQDVNEFCKELRPIEEVCYIEHKFNDQLIPLCKKYRILGMPVRKEYGGREADALAYTRALDRIGMEGTGIRTFFSGHTSIGQVPIQMWGNEEQKRKYLPASTRGEKILAFALTEPEAGSNPLEMKMTYEDKGSYYVLNGVKYLISNAGIADAIVTFGYPKGGNRISAFIIDTDREEFLKQDLTTKLG
ncbi:MAG TPA: acyl-CoA dehydrogenase family protein, partial [Candidatus Acidoferrales bacterium]|nr:acyl-CoA dehydrogenase family protein [Candidatus Acidoferrales bacterium]